MKLIDKISTISLFIALIFFIFSFNIFSFYFLYSLVIGIIGIYGLAEVILNANRQLNLIHLLAASTVIYYGLGCANSLVRIGPYILYQYNINGFQLLGALIIIHIYYIVLIGLDYFLRLNFPFFSDINLLTSKNIVSLRNHKNLYIFIVGYIIISTVLQFYGILSGHVSLGAAFFTEKMSKINAVSGRDPVSALIEYLVLPKSFILGFSLFSYKWKRHKLITIILIILIVGQVFWFFLSGRRELLFSLVMTLVGMRLGLKGNINLNLKSLMLYLPLMIVVLFFCFKAVGFYQYYRYMGHNSSIGLLDSLYSSLVSYISLDNNSTLVEKLSQYNNKNYSNRSFIIYFLCIVLQLVEKSGPLFGKDIISQFFLSLPGNFFIDKSSLLTAEYLYVDNYQIHYTDYPNSFLTSAILDFSFFGLILYPIIFILFFYAVLFLANLYKNAFINILFVSTLIPVSLSGGESATSDIFVTARNDAVIATVVLISIKLFSLRTNRINV